MRSVFDIRWQTLWISVSDKYPTNEDLRVLDAHIFLIHSSNFIISRSVMYLPLKAAPDPFLAGQILTLCCKLWKEKKFFHWKTWWHMNCIALKNVKVFELMLTVPIIQKKPILFPLHRHFTTTVVLRRRQEVGILARGEGLIAKRKLTKHNQSSNYMCLYLHSQQTVNFRCLNHFA